MIRSTPSRLAARTASRPTAPSPTTTTVLPGPASTATAPNQPVPKTSEAASRLGIRSTSGMPGMATRVPIPQRTAIPGPDRQPKHPVCQWRSFPSTGGVGGIMSSTPSSRQRTTLCLVCIESDGIVGNFSARQQPRRPRSRAFPSMALRHSFATGALKAGVSPKKLTSASGQTPTFPGSSSGQCRGRARGNPAATPGWSITGKAAGQVVPSVPNTV